MPPSDWKQKILPTLMVAGVTSLLLSLVFGGFIVYHWVLAFEATAAALALFAFAVRYQRKGTRKSKWPPLFPLAVVAAAGGAKSFFVATGADTPLLVIAVLLVGVVWFAVASWKILRSAHAAKGD